MTDLDSLLSRIAAVLDAEVVEPARVDITHALILADTGRYSELSTAEKLAVLDILNHLDSAYPAEDSTPPTEDTDPMPDGAGGRGRLGYRWL